MQDYIRICDVEKYYGNASNVTKAVDRVNFGVDRGEFVGVMGPSGSGKTTLLNMLATIDRVTSGHIYYENTDITELSEDALSDFRKNNLGFVFQDYNLLDTLTIEENILLALTMQDDVKVLDPASASRIAADQTSPPQIETAWPAESRDASPGHSPAKRNRADSSLSKHNCPDQTSEGRRLGRKQKITHNCNEILRLLGIEDIREKFPYQVSGGQKQRCACARALVNQPKLLLADEPTGALDSKAAQTLLETFTDLNRAMNATILMVTHDAFSASYCGRILFLKDGRIFHELIRGSKSRKAFLQEILDVLSTMLGYDEIPLAPGEYLVQIKPRLYKEVQKIGKDLQIADASGQNLLTCAGIVADPFSQDGHNGADYILVVPDAVLERMTPYYTELVAHVDEEIPMELQDSLDALEEEELELPLSYMLYYMEKEETEMQLCMGSDNIISYAGTYLVRDSLISMLEYILGSMIIPLFYIGLVFVCVAMTVLSVQQLSDSAKYKFRYDVLAKLGLDRRQICGLILKQLAAYYLCPALLAVVISGKMILFVSSRFVDLTGVPAAAGRFFLESIVLFFGIYLVYFIVTYVGFRRNVEEKNR